MAPPSLSIRWVTLVVAFGLRLVLYSCTAPTFWFVSPVILACIIPPLYPSRYFMGYLTLFTLPIWSLPCLFQCPTLISFHFIFYFHTHMGLAFFLQFISCIISLLSIYQLLQIFLRIIYIMNVIQYQIYHSWKLEIPSICPPFGCLWLSVARVLPPQLSGMTSSKVPSIIAIVNNFSHIL